MAKNVITGKNHNFEKWAQNIIKESIQKDLLEIVNVIQVMKVENMNLI